MPIADLSAPGAGPSHRRSTWFFNAKETHMNWDRIEGNWKQFSGKVQERWGKLTKDDLDRIKGKREELEGKLQESYGIKKEQAAKDVDEFCKSL
jgi:uncharacterized protein YjbJ (UPF0337 family)